MMVPKKGDYTVRISIDLKEHGTSSHELQIPISDQQSIRAAQGEQVPPTLPPEA